MSSIVTPTWTEVTTIIAPTKLQSGGAGWARGTLDLRTKYGANIFLKIGRLTTTVLATPINVYVRRVLNAGVTGTNLPFEHPSPPLFQSQTAVTVCPTVNTNASAGAKTLVLNAGTSMVAGDTICITDGGGSLGTAFTRTEFKTISKVSSNTLTLTEGLDYAHTAAQADVVSRLADIITPFAIPGGSVWEVIFDYQVSATGGDVVVMAHAQLLESHLVT